MKVIQFEAYGAPVVGYLHDSHDRMVHHTIRPAVIVCPGGGYYMVSAREADPPAMEYFTQGYNVFILTYAVLEQAVDFRPLRQLAATVSAVRASSEEWGVDPEKIAVIGFSAGGHLAASLGVYWNDREKVLAENCRPNTLLLCYPVITMGEYTHLRTRENVTGGDDAQREVFSIEKHITADFPPSFIWHTVEDNSVPVENSLMLMQQLRKNGVCFEAHLFPHGEHGISTCTLEVETLYPDCAPWLPLSKTWLNRLFDFIP